MSGDDRPALVLFRRDLRIADNRALRAAAGSGRPVLAAFVMDEESEDVRPSGAASRWWLHHSLAALKARIAGLGGTLVLRKGRTDRIVAELVETSGAAAVFWNRRYDPAEAAVDKAMKSVLRAHGIAAESFDGELLHEPTRLATASGGHYKVYGAFWKALAASPEPRDPLDPPGALRPFAGEAASQALDDIVPLPCRPDWAATFRERWTPGEDGARERLGEFLGARLDDYARRRDLPGIEGTSLLSPHLAHGEITPFQIVAGLRGSAEGAAKFRKELGWREFCHHLLFHDPRLRERNFQPDFDRFAYRRDEDALRAWRNGRTGYPIVDAGMRELWRTGHMHNRMRMVTASFLTKHLMIDWRAGEGWFWDTLVDADPASNPGNWQWVAGSGADAAPFFRIFNPVLQGEKFDAGGAYVRRWVPELAGLPDRYVHAPWQAPAGVLRESGVTLGETYPAPVVDHAAARRRALDAYRNMRAGR